MKEFICKEEIGGGMFMHMVYEPEQELVRCKKCKYRGKIICPMFEIDDDGNPVDYATDNWFCADGEKD